MNFNDTYSRDSFRTLVKELLPDYTDDVRQVSAAAPSPHIQEARLLGESRDLELSVFEIQHSGSADKRISLAQAGFRLMKGVACYRALIAYYSTDTDSWRLSLMTLNPAINQKGTVSLESSNPRRYSYFLGPDAKTHTPHDRLVKSGAAKNFEDLLARFSVEVVTNEFFKRYKDLFENLVKHLEKDHAFIGFAARSNVAIEDFAKKLLGQIVFIYFLQRKRWVGAKKGKSIHEGDKDFLRSLFQKAKSEQKNFFNEYLEPLFYDGLNNPPKRAGSFYREYFDCQIPFLNGGLFEPLNNYDWRNAFLFIPDELFSNGKDTGILDVFDLYNFTVAEDDPIDVEVSVDPEMLGKVFENLLAENLRKGKGTYYTPRAIVHYMCRESLINYLTSETGVDIKEIRRLYEWDDSPLTFEDVKGEERPRNKVFVYWGDFAKNQAPVLLQALETIKVVDPACGSGAFLVGMLQEIVHLKRKLALIADQPYSDYETKKTAIQNSIYGVDIDPGAVDIAKLRLWLAMVVDYGLDDIEPLPNLDYKIMQGNSLLEELVVGDTTLKLYDPKLNNGPPKRRRKNLFEEDDQPDLFGQTSGQHRLIDELNRLHREYFELSDLNAKRRKREQIKAIEHELVERTVQQELKKLEGQSKNIGKNLSPVTGMSNKDAEQYAENLSKQAQLSAILQEFDASTNRPYFLWHLNFADVFEQNGGFDVVIANPPYVKEAVNRRAFDGLRNKDCYQGKMDLWYLFGSLSLDLLRPGGVQCFIATNNWVSNDGASKFRNKVLSGAQLINLVDFGNLKIFQAGIQTMIYLLRKGKPPNKYSLTYGRYNKEEIVNSRLSEFLQVENSGIDFDKFSFVLEPGEYMDEYLRILPPRTSKVINTISAASKHNLKSNEVFSGMDVMQDFVSKKHLEKLGDKVNVGDGIFVLSNEEKNKIPFTDEELSLVRPYYTAREMGRYCGDSRNRLWVLYTSSEVNKRADDFPNITKHLDKFQKVITSVNKPYGLHRTRDEDNFENEKILSLRKCATPTFTYVDFTAYVSRAFLVIRTGRFNQKFLVALLNSDLVAFWLRHKGKLQGNYYQVDKKPLLSIPIVSPSDEEEKKLTELTEKILSVCGSKSRISEQVKGQVKKYEQEVNSIVYKMYGLEDEEIEIVEKEARR